jgi:CcmD family protein
MGIYYTLAATLVIWVGLFLYMLRIDRRLADLEGGE